MASTKFAGVLVLLALLNVCAVAVTNPCYFPNGNLAPSYIPCSPNGDGDCCAENDFCTSLGYCISNVQGYHYRGACTDVTWFNPSCPDYCLADSNSGNSSSVNVLACNAAKTGGSWCCAYNGNCCSSSTFVPVFGTIFAEQGASTSSHASSATPSISTLISASTTGASVSNTTAGSTSSISQTSANSNTVKIVGAILGVALGLAILGGLVLFFTERRKRIRIEQERTKEISDYNNGKEIAAHQNKAKSSSIRTTHQKRHELSAHRPLELPTGHEL